MEHISESVSDTINFAKALALKLKGGEILALSGDLGAGKTVFAKGIAKGLGITDNVVSPTFTIIRQYEGRFTFNHLDLYRIKDGGELYELGIDDLFSPHSVCVIEWAENARGTLPDKIINVNIEKLDADKRKITVTGLE